LIQFLKKRKQEPWTELGTGIHLDRPDKIISLGYPDSFRKGHFWCFGTTRVGKTRTMENIIEQDYFQKLSSWLLKLTERMTSCS